MKASKAATASGIRTFWARERDAVTRTTPARTSTESSSEAISIGVKWRSSERGWPLNMLANTSTGATKRAIWMPLPTAI